MTVFVNLKDIIGLVVLVLIAGFFGVIYLIEKFRK